MQPSQYERAQQLFLEVCDLSAEQRDTFLRENCDDQSVRFVVEKMLIADQETGELLPRDLDKMVEEIANNSLDFGIFEPSVQLRDLDESDDDDFKAVSSDVPWGESIRRYAIKGEIARGGMGAVLKCRDKKLGRNLAIKVLLESRKDDPVTIQRFIEEAQIGGQLQHPSIAPVYELGYFDDGRPFISMKLINGQTLKKLLTSRESPQTDLPRFLGIFEQVCQAVAYVHTRGVIHRDLKSTNIMVGSFGEVQVMDWGLAKVIGSDLPSTVQKKEDPPQESIVRTARTSPDSSLPSGGSGSSSNTQMGTVLGTPAYMPPEQAMGEIDQLDERVDVFSLGAILCEILTGKPPYHTEKSSADALKMAIRGNTTECLSRLDECGADHELVELTKECLEIETEDRPRDAGFVAARITGYLESVQTKLQQAAVDSAAQETRIEEERKRRILSYVMAGLIAAFAFSGVIVWQQYVSGRTNQQADAMVNLLSKSDINQLPEVLDSIEPMRKTILPKLRNQFANSEDGSAEKIRLSLALLESDSSQANYLFSQLSQVEAEEFDVAQKTLETNNYQPSAEALESLWSNFLDRQKSPAERFRTACVLAVHDSDDERWSDQGEELADLLTVSDLAVVGSSLGRRLRQIKSSSDILFPHLLAVMQNQDSSEFSRDRSANCLAVLQGDNLPKLVETALLCRRSREFANLLPELNRNSSKAKQILTQQFLQSSELTQKKQTDQTDRLAIAAVLLGNLGDLDALLSIMGESSTESGSLDRQTLVRKYAREIPVDSQSILDAMDNEDVSNDLTFQLVKFLGYQNTSGISNEARSKISKRLQQLASETLDAGIREASLWALSNLAEPVPADSVAESIVGQAAAKRIRELDAEIAKTESEREAAIENVSERRKAWEETLAKREQDEFDVDESDLMLRISYDRYPKLDVTTNSVNAAFIEKQLRNSLAVEGLRNRTFEFMGHEAANLSDAASFERNKPFSYGAWVYVDPNKSSQWSAVFSRMDSKLGYRGVDLWIDGKRFGAHINHQEPNSYIKVVTAENVNRTYFHHMFVTYDGSSKANGVKLYFDGRLQESEIISDSLMGSISVDKPLLLGARSDGETPFYGWVEDIRIYGRELSADEVNSVYLSTINLILKIQERDNRLKNERRVPLQNAFRDDRLVELERKLRQLREERDLKIWEGRRRWFTNIQGQSFAMLSNTEERTFDDEKLDYDFAIGTHEVTVEQFRKFKPDFEIDQDALPTANCPIGGISWFEAAEYCNWLGEQEGIPRDQWCFEPNEEGQYAFGMTRKENFRELSGYRMPTPIEWQFACRGNSTSRFYFGGSEELMKEHAWFRRNSGGVVHPVGQLSPNRFGLFDMYGNVEEWTFKVDRYRARSFKVDVKSNAFVKGGGADGFIDALTTDVYALKPPTTTSPFRGLRLAKSIVHASDSDNKTD